MSDRETRKKKLDDAVREYITSAQAAGDVAPQHYVTGWVIGVATGGYDNGSETDNILTESSPGINNFMAAGLSAAVADVFHEQMMGYPNAPED